MNPELAYYVIRYYGNFMTDAESRANLHLIGTVKTTFGRDDAAAQQEAKQKKPNYPLLSDDPEVVELSKDGMRAFRERTAIRILEDQGSDVFLNYCPRCQGLARTPQARQCRFCGQDWHPTKPD